MAGHTKQRKSSSIKQDNEYEHLRQRVCELEDELADVNYQRLDEHQKKVEEQTYWTGPMTERICACFKDTCLVCRTLWMRECAVCDRVFMYKGGAFARCKNKACKGSVDSVTPITDADLVFLNESIEHVLRDTPHVWPVAYIQK